MTEKVWLALAYVAAVAVFVSGAIYSFHQGWDGVGGCLVFGALFVNISTRD